MVNLKRKKTKQNKTKTILKCLTTKSRGFNQDFKNENLCFCKFVLSSHSENTRPVAIDHGMSSRMKNETSLQL